jgi:hypothetical protein
MTKPKKPETIGDLIKLTDKENPKPEDLQRLRNRLNDNANLVEINEISERAFGVVIKTYSSSALMKELFERQIESKRKALDYESENVIMQMLINQVILCHIRVNAFEAFHAEKTRESLSIAYGLYLDKLLSTYQRRFQKACESLAKVRKLLSEAELRDQQARNKRSQSTLAAQKLYKALSD